MFLQRCRKKTDTKVENNYMGLCTVSIKSRGSDYASKVSSLTALKKCNVTDTVER